MGEKRDNIEVRLNKDGSVDEIVIQDPHTGRCLFHLEQMDSHYYWMRAYGITKDLVAHIGAGIGERNGKPIEDDRGFITGYEKVPNCPVVESDFEWEDAATEFDTQEQTPAAERHRQIAEIVNQYGVPCVLQEIADILKQGQ